MTPTAVLFERAEGSSKSLNTVTSIRRTPGRPTVLIATIDPEIRNGLSDLLEKAAIDAIWVNGVKDVKVVVAREPIAACLCGFWLQDGTYREVIRHLRLKRLEIPAIIVSSPACPHEFRDYLAAMNLQDLDFLSYPYQQSDLERMLESAIAAQSGLDADEAGELRERGAA